MSENNSELDRTKYDFDKEYVEGEHYGLKELVKILDPAYKDGKELSKSLVYDRLRKTIEPQLEKLFHIDIDEFKKNEDEKVRFYYLQFLKELYSVEYPSNKNVENASDKNVENASDKNVGNASDINVENASDKNVENPSDTNVENASDINVENPSDENKVKLQGLLKSMSGEYIKDKNPQKSSTELDKIRDKFIQKIEKKIFNIENFDLYIYNYIKNPILEMESQWRDRIMSIYDMVYNGKGNGGGEDYSADWNLDKINKLLDLLYERVSKLEGKRWIDKSHNMFITFYISSLCNEYIRNSITLREYLNEKNYNNRRPEPVFPNIYFLTISTSRLELNQEEQCEKLKGLIEQVCKEKMLSYSSGDRTPTKIVCYILGEKIENLPKGIQLTNEQCNDLLFASKPERTDKILAEWKSSKTSDCEKSLFPVFVSIIQMLYNLRSDKEMRKYSIPGNPKKSLDQVFSKKKKKSFEIVKSRLLEIVEDNLLRNSKEIEILYTVQQIMETLLKIEKITFSICDLKTFLDVNNYVLDAIDLITMTFDEYKDYRDFFASPLLPNDKFERSLLVRRIIRCKLNLLDILMIKKDIDELLDENDKTLPMVRDNKIYTIYIMEGKKFLLIKKTDELFVLVKEGDGEVLHGFPCSKYGIKTLKAYGIVDYADYYDDVMDDYRINEVVFSDDWIEDFELKIKPSPLGKNERTTGFFFAFDLKDFFERHGKAFGCSSEEEYLERGIDLLTKPCTNGIVGYARSDGKVVRFNTTTGEYVSGYPGKKLCTYMIPKDNEGVDLPKALAYYNKQRLADEAKYGVAKKEQMIERSCMGFTNETEIRICPRCGSTEYDSEKGNCAECGWSAYAEEPEIPEVRPNQYLDKKRCPVCSKKVLLAEGSVCEVCGWFNDLVQADDPDEECGQNDMSLNKARVAYLKGLPKSLKKYN